MLVVYLKGGCFLDNEKMKFIIINHMKYVLTVVVFQAQNDRLGSDGLIPQLFTSVPSLNDAASYLAQTTSLITGCFSDYTGKLASPVWFSFFFSFLKLIIGWDSTFISFVLEYNLT